MGGKNFAFVWLSVWAVVYTLSFVVAANAAAKDMGLTRGLNRVTTFIGWQFAAAVLAVVVWSYASHFEAGTWLRWVFRIPAMLAVALLAFVLFLIVSANITKPRPTSGTPTPGNPVTALPAQPQSTLHSGYYRQGFEQSDFYTLKGDGPYWLDAADDVWAQLQSHLIPKHGRGSSVTVKLTVEGEKETGGEFGHLGAYQSRLYAKRIIQIEPITPEEYDTIVQGFRDARDADK